MTILTTAAAAKLLGRSPEAVRWYERTGKLPALRTTTGQRLFDERDVVRLREELAAR